MLLCCDPKMDSNLIHFGQCHYGAFAIHHFPPPSDTELTNLNWVAGAPVPMQNPVSPKRKGASYRSKHAQREDAKIHGGSSSTSAKQQTSADKTCISAGSTDPITYHSSEKAMSVQSKSETVSNKKENGKTINNNKTKGEVPGEKKPNCSYTSLIGLALMASDGGCLPVCEIYTYIEDEFPYFRSAPDGWKNSIRHNLSLNPAFRKVKDSMKWQGRKGYYWEVTPERRSSVEREVERFLRQEGKLRDAIETDGETAPFPSCLHASIPVMPHTPCTGFRPMFPFQFCTGTQPYYDIASSMQRHYPQLAPPHAPSTLPPHTSPPLTTSQSNMMIPPVSTAMVTLLDTDLSPGQFAGFSDPTGSTTNSALHDLFGLHISSPKPLQHHSYRQHCTGDDDAYYSTQPPPMCTHSLCGGLQPDYMLYSTDEKSPDLAVNGQTVRLRKQALDQLTLPQESYFSNWTTDSSVSIINEFLCTPSYLQLCKESPFDGRMTLEECFMEAEQSDCDCGSNDEECCGEVPLPPSVRTQKEAEQGKEGREKSDSESQKNPNSGAYQSNGGECASRGCGGRRRGRRAKRRRGPPRNKPATASSQREQTGSRLEDSVGGSQPKRLRGGDSGEDMLSSVSSDSELSMRRLLCPATASVVHAGLTADSMEEDGIIYSPPSIASNIHTPLFIPQHEVY